MAVTVGASPPTNAQKTAFKSAFDLGNVNNTSDLSKPISTATQTALNGKEVAGAAASAVAAHEAAPDPHPQYTTPAEAAAAAPVQSVAGKTGAVTLAKVDVGLANVDNTSDLNKPVSIATQSAIDAKQNALGYTPENAAQKGQPGGYAQLDASGKVSTAQLPAYVDEVQEYATLSAFPATGESGVIYMAQDAQTLTYRWGGSAYVPITSGAVVSVSGKTGAVSLDAADVGLGQVNNTSDADKPVSTATLSALAGKEAAGTAAAALSAHAADPDPHPQYATPAEAAAAAPVQSVAGRTGAVTLTKGDVGLALVDNTSDAAKPISTATQIALNAKQAELASGVTLKTVNGESLLGAGNLEIAGAGDVDGNAVKLQIKSLTRAQLEAAATGGTLIEREPYLITDEGRLAVGISATEYSAFLLEGEGGGAAGDILRTPESLSPAPGSTVGISSPLLICGAYYSSLSTLQDAAQFQLSASADFSVPLHDSGTLPATDSYTVPDGVLAVSTAYYWRARYRSLLGQWSEWGGAISFTTAANFNDYIASPIATPAAFGDPLEGGFYAGMIWNELVQSASSTAISTGTKTLTVPSMTGAPIVYSGQTLEVRSRANPENKMIGTVTGALGTTLTLNVTSVGGSGTFADWSIMSRYRVIVAPKASGENASIVWKNATSAAPVATGTLTEGRKATLAMVAAGDSAVYPAAHWCNDLDINGKTDWYMPSRDELELCWRNLKPVTEANYATADRKAAATPNYQNLGAYGGTEVTHGLNKNSEPAGAAYTSAVPAQTDATAFRVGGAEAFAYGAAWYWSSTEYDDIYAWCQFWYTSFAGNQHYAYGKNNTSRLRAVRRSII